MTTAELYASFTSTELVQLKDALDAQREKLLESVVNLMRNEKWDSARVLKDVEQAKGGLSERLGLLIRLRIEEESLLG